MSWDKYTKAVIRLRMPDGDIVVAPAPPGRTVGTYPEDDRPIHIVNAHNRGGRPASARGQRQGSRTTARPDPGRRAYTLPRGRGARALTHVEAGVALVGLDEVQAGELSRQFGHDAIFEWSRTALAILSCTARRARHTGWTATPAQTPTETFRHRGHWSKTSRRTHRRWVGSASQTPNPR